jgi:hypothetical protein
MGPALTVSPITPAKDLKSPGNATRDSALTTDTTICWAMELLHSNLPETGGRTARCSAADFVRRRHGSHAT